MPSRLPSSIWRCVRPATFPGSPRSAGRWRPTRTAGRLTLRADASTVEMPEVFVEPLPLDALNAKVTWSMAGRAAAGARGEPVLRQRAPGGHASPAPTRRRRRARDGSIWPAGSPAWKVRRPGATFRWSCTTTCATGCRPRSLRAVRGCAGHACAATCSAFRSPTAPPACSRWSRGCATARSRMRRAGRRWKTSPVSSWCAASA